MKIKLPNQNKPSFLVNKKTAIINASMASLVLSSVFVLSHAAGETPTLDKPSYTIKINKPATSATKSAVKAETQSNNVTGTLIESTNRTVRLNDGGVVWVTTDPVALTPRLAISTSRTVEMSGKQLKNPITFTLSTNYAAFISSWEIKVFKENDEDQRNPLAKLSGGKFTSGHSVKWDGKTLDGSTLSAGNNLRYVLTVKDTKGHVDKTNDRTIVLQGADRKFAADTANEFNGSDNDIASQTIPLRGARVRIHGSDIVDNQSISIDGETARLQENKFVVERLLPEGKHNFSVDIKSGSHSYTKQLSTDVNGRYMFLVGLADVTVGEGNISGNLETSSDDDRQLDGDIFVDGRLAFYLKGKIKGKYLITAQADTGTNEIDELFTGFLDKDPESLFRRLDPEEFYPVYGDDSTIIDDTNSQGRLFVRVDWDKSQALWGNYNTDITGTELSAYNRGLYGAKLNHKSTKTTEEGKHKTDVTVFASEAQSAFAHNQFLGTGGSLYYLNNTDIVDGSEKVWVEVRERNGDRVVQQVVMEEGRDYQIDDFQGRIILNRPLLQIAEQSGPSLVKDDPLDGNQVYLMVDYEYVPDDFDADQATYGANGKVWVNDHFAVGGTVIHENRDNNDYDLRGVDITLQKAKGTYIVAEYAETESLQATDSLSSIDGGLSFDQLDNPTATNNFSGSAYSIEARANLKDVINKDGSIGAWYKFRDAGFSTARLSQGEDVTDAGIEAIIDVNDALKLSAKATVYDREETSKLTTASIQGDYQVNDKLSLAAEVRHVEEEDQSATATGATDGEGTLLAFKVGYDVKDDVNVYLVGQTTLADDGNYESNDLVTIGTKARLTRKLNLLGELSTGDRGDSATVGVDYKHNDSHSFYTNYTFSKESNTTERNLFTVGQRKSVTDRLNVFTEHQFTRETSQSGLGQSFGVDYKATDNVLLNASIQTVNLDRNDGGVANRDAFSVGLNYDKNKTRGSSKLEYRRDKGDSVDTEQWVTTNRLNYRVSPALRYQTRLNYSITKDQSGGDNDARFIEAGIGFALRPVFNDRLNVLGRLTYVNDLQPLSQSNNVDERSLIASLESSYQVNQRWEIGGKLAHRTSEIRTDRNTGDYVSNDATLVSGRVRYHLTHNWDATAQYHWLGSEESNDSQHGALLSVDRHIGKNLKVGVGYNFTRFDDDLSNDGDGDAKGWFINFVGKF